MIHQSAMCMRSRLWNTLSRREYTLYVRTTLSYYFQPLRKPESAVATNRNATRLRKKLKESQGNGSTIDSTVLVAQTLDAPGDALYPSSVNWWSDFAEVYLHFRATIDVAIYWAQNKMGLPQLTTCCFVFDLKTGCIIMGSINAVLSFSLLTILIVIAATVGAIDPELEYPGDIEKQAGLTGLYAMSIILVLMFLFKFLFDVSFVFAVHTERRGIIKAYMIMWIVFFLLSMFIFFLNSPNFNAGTICTEIVYIGHNVYTILLCHSFYKQLNSREEV